METSMIEKVVKANLKAGSSEEVIKMLGNLLLSEGYVKETYVDAVLERERILPTGLIIDGINVAIPHTDSTHVNETMISLATLNKIVKFNSMTDPEKEVDVNIVFLLAVKDPKEQVNALRKLMAIFKNKEILTNMKNAKDSQHLTHILTTSLT